MALAPGNRRNRIACLAPEAGTLYKVSGHRVKDEAQVLATRTPALFQTAVRQAVHLLRAGELVALPTETVYGLAANALDAKAVEKIFKVKGRPGHNPIIVHVVGIEMVRRCVAEWPASAARLAAAFWPGPLTLVLARASEIPDVVTAGGPTVGVRWPSHPFIQAVIQACGFPLAAPSANPSTRISPTTAEHVRKSLGTKIRLIVDGGASQVGIESTVLDLTLQPPRVLRPGIIHTESLEAVLGKSGMRTVDCGMPPAMRTALKSPGQLAHHYSPQAKLVILSWRDDADLRRQISNLKFAVSRCHVIAHTQLPSARGFGRMSVLPREAPAFAQAIYAELHRCDEAGAQVIVVEALPEGVEWHGLTDRLRRASGHV